MSTETKITLYILKLVQKATLTSATTGSLTGHCPLYSMLTPTHVPILGTSISRPSSLWHSHYDSPHQRTLPSFVHSGHTTAPPGKQPYVTTLLRVSAPLKLAPWGAAHSYLTSDSGHGDFSPSSSYEEGDTVTLRSLCTFRTPHPSLLLPAH